MRFLRGGEMPKRRKKLADGQRLSVIYSNPCYRDMERIGKRYNLT
jgi:hypothetical protein